MPYQELPRIREVRPPVAGAPLFCNAHEHGLRGDGVTNDQPAFAALVDKLGDGYAADGRARLIYCPPGIYSIRNAGTVWRSGVSLIGAGVGATRFLLSNEGNRADPVPLAYFTTLDHGAGRHNHIADCTFADFEIDGSGVALAEYNYLAKGLGLQYVLRGIFRNLYIHHTGATGLGCDFLQDTVIQNVIVEGCGRLDNGKQMGGGGIGIGIGGWGTVERTTVAGCTAICNGTNGIFVELQQRGWPPPRGIRIIGCHSGGNRFGISDWGADGLLVSSCTLVGNLETGYNVSAEGAAGIAGRGGIVTDCVIDGNMRDGISVGNTPGPYTIRGNRITGNGAHGFHEHNVDDGYAGVTLDVVLESNEFWGNGLDGVRIDRVMGDLVILNNRIRNNGRQCNVGACGSGDTIRYSELSVVDRVADWPHDGHRGKTVRVGKRVAVVAANSSTELTLAPVRPDSLSGWSADTPLPGTRYDLLDAPDTRAGIAVNARITAATIKGNLIWDNHEPKTQTHGLWVTEQGALIDCRVEENDFSGNARAATRLDNRPIGGRWNRNHEEFDESKAATAPEGSEPSQ